MTSFITENKFKIFTIISTFLLIVLFATQSFGASEKSTVTLKNEYAKSGNKIWVEYANNNSFISATNTSDTDVFISVKKPIVSVLPDKTYHSKWIDAHDAVFYAVKLGTAGDFYIRAEAGGVGRLASGTFSFWQ